MTIPPAKDRERKRRSLSASLLPMCRSGEIDTTLIPVFHFGSNSNIIKHLVGPSPEVGSGGGRA